MVVELHEGTISATSPGPGQGATFAITLPVLDVAARGPAEGGPTPVPTAVAAPRGGRILLVEDHAPTRATLERLLVRRKFAVAAAGSLDEARQLAREQTFDLLISDVGLPDGNGYDLMRECAGAHGLTGIALTGFGMEQDVARSRAAGFAAHLTKPVNVHALDRAIADALSRKLPSASAP
jgi:CheY-like chemotaxis protein